MEVRDVDRGCNALLRREEFLAADSAEKLRDGIAVSMEVTWDLHPPLVQSSMRSISVMWDDRRDIAHLPWPVDRD
jgi:hypothetical protein